MQRASLQFLPAALLTGLALAQAPDVAIVAAANFNPADCRYTDVQNYLQASGLFNSVDIVDCVTSTPSLADLQGYDAVITWSVARYDDRVEMGNVLADYVDGGGGVVSAAFATLSTDPFLQLDGRWRTGGYEVITAGQGVLETPASLGTTVIPGHPVMQGVSTLTASRAYRPLLTTVLVQGSVVAEWDDGAILVAQGNSPKRIDLGLYPPSDACLLFYWEATGDGDRLVANALLAVAGDGGPGTSYCTPNPNVTGQPGRFAASGSGAAASNNLTLSASSLPLFSFSFFLVSRNQSFVPNPAGSAGNLCLGGMIGRYVGPGQVQQANTSGNIQLSIDLTMIPQPLGFVAVQPGETWNFQAWYRDSAGGIPTSNFTDGYSITFQ